MARPRHISDTEVLEIARLCFLEQGPGVSTTVIAERVGLSQAALFKRFKTKKELMMAALLPPAVPPFIGQIEKGPTRDQPLDEQLAELGLSVLVFFQEVVPCVATLTASGFDKDDLFKNYDIPPPIRTQMAMTQWFQRARDLHLIRDVAPIDSATSFLGTLHVRAFMRHVGSPQSEDPSDYIRTVVDIFLRGVEEAR